MKSGDLPMSDDPGTIAFVISLKRTKGDCPKLTKVLDDRIYHTEEDAREGYEAIKSESPELYQAFEVRGILVYFTEAAP